MSQRKNETSKAFRKGIKELRETNYEFEPLPKNPPNSFILDIFEKLVLIERTKSQNTLKRLDAVERALRDIKGGDKPETVYRGLMDSLGKIERVG